MVIVEEPRLRLFDFEEWLWPRPTGPARVMVVDIDEESLARYGQWPWPRTLVAELVRRIAEARPPVLGIDIVFAEPDRLSPPEIARELPGLPAPLADQLAHLPASERDLAEALRAVPTVLAVAPGREDKAAFPGSLHPAPIRQAGGDPIPFLKDYKSLLASLPELAPQLRDPAPAPWSRMTMVSCGASLWSQTSEERSFRHLPSKSCASPTRNMRSSSTRGARDRGCQDRRHIDPDRQGRAAIPHFSPRASPRISAGDVLDPGFDPAAAERAIVLLGVASLAIGGLQQTPLGPIAGIDINAQLVESMLFEGFLRRPWYIDWVELGVTLAAGLGAIWLLRYNRPVSAAGIALVVIAGLMGVEFLSFRFLDLLFDGFYPSATLLAAFGAC